MGRCRILPGSAGCGDSRGSRRPAISRRAVGHVVVVLVTPPWNVWYRPTQCPTSCVPVSPRLYGENEPPGRCGSRRHAVLQSWLRSSTGRSPIPARRCWGVRVRSSAWRHCPEEGALHGRFRRRAVTGRKPGVVRGRVVPACAKRNCSCLLQRSFRVGVVEDLQRSARSPSETCPHRRCW